MKIALVTRRYPPLIGGAEKILSYLAPAMAAEGADVTVVTSLIPNHASKALDAVSPVPIIRLPTSRLRFVGTILYMRALRRFLLDSHPDLIYVSMLKHDAYVAVQVGQKLKIPVVLRPEGAGATGDLAWQKWGRFGSKIGKVCQKANAFVAISASIRDEMIAAGYDATRIYDLPNGVPVPENPWTPPPDEQSPMAAFVGRLAPEKNLGMLIDAWSIVTKRRPNARIMLIGDGPEHEALKDRAGSNNSSVIFHGADPNPGLFLRDCNLFVLPSREEGMSIALLEAMALGIPIVASDIPGNRRLISHEIHGLLAPFDSPKSFAAAILSQWENRERAMEMAGMARRRVIADYSIASVAKQHLELFKQLTLDSVGRGNSSCPPDPK